MSENGNAVSPYLTAGMSFGEYATAYIIFSNDAIRYI